jgi:hypothetical protein
MAIDIGPGATNRASNQSLAGKTVIDLNNAAGASGTLDTLEIWAYTNISNCRIGVFYLVSGTTYKCRSSTPNLGTVTAGAKRTFTAPDDFTALSVETGDFIGVYGTAGAVEKDVSGYAGVRSVTGEYIDPDDQASYSLLSGDAASLFGSGTESGGSTVSLAATIAGSSVMLGGAGINRGVAGSCNGVSQIVASLKMGWALNAAIPALAAVAGDLKITRGLAGQCAGVSSIAGSLSVTRVVQLAAQIAAAGSLQGSVKMTRGMAAAIAGSGQVAGKAEMDYALAAAIAGSGVLLGALTVTAAMTSVKKRRGNLACGRGIHTCIKL